MQMSAISAASLYRRVRIRSWKDLVAMLIAGAIYYGLYWLLVNKAGMSERNARIIAMICGVIVCVMLLFAFRGGSKTEKFIKGGLSDG